VVDVPRGADGQRHELSLCASIDMSALYAPAMLLGAVWLYSTDVPRAAAFYRDEVGLPLLDDRDSVVHFDAGNIRLSIHPARPDAPTGTDAFFVFVVDDIEETIGELSSRGVRFEGGVVNEPYGRIVEFRDPDGHELYLWQMPREGEAEYENVKPLAHHYAFVRSALRR